MAQKEYTVEYLLKGSSNRISIKITANSSGLAVDAVKKMFPGCTICRVY